jgi:hypothetical protein
MSSVDESYARKLRVGTYTLVGLLILDIVEYAVGVGFNRGSTLPLAVLAIPQAWLILRYFMHVLQLRRGGEH